ncbi:hypothetical protein EG328_007618 [Venturia inaequalis]|uniref:1,3-beta-glucanosyltransferase n=1 Tax=Venturia inaequalis TaxID=5025 RepID=A0A8H3UEZ0_VENIN|nr:hypothetical protein EG328_007618 [Venturia inaequalis]
MRHLLQAGLLLTSASSVLSELTPLSIKGSKIYNKDGTQFFIKGIQIFSPASFSLVSPEQCKVDADLARSLGVNSVRFEDVGTQNHGECMRIYSEAGIYVWVGIDGLGESSRGVCIRLYLRPMLLLFWRDVYFLKAFYGAQIRTANMPEAEFWFCQNCLDIPLNL